MIVLLGCGQERQITVKKLNKVEYTLVNLPESRI